MSGRRFDLLGAALGANRVVTCGLAQLLVEFGELGSQEVEQCVPVR